MNNSEKMTQANTEGDNNSYDLLAQEPSFDEHMKEMRGKEEIHIDIDSEEVKRAKEEIDRRMKDGEDYISIMDSFSPNLQRQLYASWLEKSPAPANPPIEEDEFRKIEENNRRSHEVGLDADSRADIF